MALSQKGAISFALVYIPVDMYTAVQDNDIRFNQLSKSTQGRVRYKKIDESTGEELKSDDIVKAYQYDKGKYVVVTDEDMEKIKTEKDKTVQILQFTDIDAISPVFYNRAYYVLPQKGGEKAFELLRKAMDDKGKVAIGKTVMGSTETTLALIPEKRGILMETMYYNDEVRELPREVPQPSVSDAELEMAEKLVDAMAKPFEPESFKDEYQERLRELIESKIEGKEISMPAQPKTKSVVNLMDALKASLEQSKPAKTKAAPRRKQRAG